MFVSDRDKLNEVIRDWYLSAGDNNQVTAVLSMLQQLDESMGNHMTLDLACDTLNELSKYALEIKKSLLKKRDG